MRPRVHLLRRSGRRHFEVASKRAQCLRSGPPTARSTCGGSPRSLGALPKRGTGAEIVAHWERSSIYRTTHVNQSMGTMPEIDLLAQVSAALADTGVLD